MNLMSYELVDIEISLSILDQHHQYRLDLLPLHSAPTPREVSGAMFSVMAWVGVASKNIDAVPSPVDVLTEFHSIIDKYRELEESEL